MRNSPVLTTLRLDPKNIEYLKNTNRSKLFDEVATVMRESGMTHHEAVAILKNVSGFLKMAKAAGIVIEKKLDEDYMNNDDSDSRTDA